MYTKWYPHIVHSITSNDICSSYKLDDNQVVDIIIESL